MLFHRRPCARQALLKQKRVLMHEPERDKFGESARLRLNLAEQGKLPHPMIGSFHVSIH